jgi:L-lactate dehydrogenase complex protein LldE
MIREYYPALARENEDAGMAAAVGSLLPRVFEFSELLVDALGVTDVGAYFPHRVTYHASCHGLRSLHLGDKPLRLLRAVRGLELVPLDGLEQCCGFGGTFAVKNADVSAAMLTEKTRAVLNTRAEVCTACDNSCLMHMQGMLHRQFADVRTLHLAEVLANTEVVPA